MRTKAEIFLLIEGMKKDQFKMGTNLANFVAFYLACHLNFKEYKTHYHAGAKKKHFRKHSLIRREKNIIDFTIGMIKECVKNESVTLEQYGSIIAGLWMLELDHMIDIPDEFDGELTGYMGLILDALIARMIKING